MNNTTDEVSQNDSTNEDVGEARSHTDGSSQKIQEQTGEQPSTFPIIGIGASAGGLTSLEELFAAMKPDSGAGFVLVQHLSPDFESLTVELLARKTAIPIQNATDGLLVERNRIYVLPSGKDIAIFDGRLTLKPRSDTVSCAVSIDHFFESLAEDCGANAVGIVLSGTGSDGSSGSKSIHAAGGIVLAEEPETAEFDGMPRSVILTGIVDAVLTPKSMAAAIEKISSGDRSKLDESVPASGIKAVLQLMLQHHGIDFAQYRPATIDRRIERRLEITNTSSLDEYGELLRTDPSERNLLYEDLLIGVTSFFRDKKAFDNLAEKVIPQLLNDFPPEETIRVWSCACATGEETYSIAILLHEALAAAGRPINFKIFATDAHRKSLEIAGMGCYSNEKLKNVSDERRHRFFTSEIEGWRVSRELRNRIVFANHNLLRDAPFTNMHLVTCRNLLIYFLEEARDQAISTFHYAMKQGGFLMLGSSESIGKIENQFDVVSEYCRTFKKNASTVIAHNSAVPDFVVGLSEPSLDPNPISRRPHAVSPDRSKVEFQDELLKRFMPPAFLVDADRNLLQTFGNASSFLQIRDGRLCSDLLELLNCESPELIGAVFARVKRDGFRAKVPAISLCNGDQKHAFEMIVERIELAKSEQRYLFWLSSISTLKRQTSAPIPVIEEEKDESSFVTEKLSGKKLLDQKLVNTQALRSDSVADKVVSDDAVSEIVRLRSELAASRNDLRTTVRELEASNVHISSVNEMMTTANEELQCSNEELNTLNEELLTINTEYQRKIAELNVVNSDMSHLLSTSDIAILFLDCDLKIRRFTPHFAETFDLIESDIGRRLDVFVGRIGHLGLMDDLEEVLQTGQSKSLEINDPNNIAWFLSIAPYNINDKVDGVVLSLTNISSLSEARRSVEQLSAIVETSQSAIFSSRSDRTITSWNSGAEKLFGYTAAEAIGQNVTMLIPNDQMEDASVLAEKLESGTIIEPLEVKRLHKNQSSVDVSLTLSPIHDNDGRVIGSSAICLDITMQKAAERRTTAEHSVARVLNESENIDEAIPEILLHVCDTLDISAAEFWTTDDYPDELTLSSLYASNNSEESDTSPRSKAIAQFRSASESSSYHRGEGLLGTVWKRGKPIHYSDLDLMIDPSRAAAAKHLGLKSGYALPVRVGKEFVGVLLFFSRLETQFDEGTCNTLRVISRSLGQFVGRNRAIRMKRDVDERMRSIVETSLDAIIVMNDNGKVLQWNRNAVKTFGFKAKEAIGSQLADLVIPPDDRDEHRRVLGKFLDSSDSKTVRGKRVELMAMRKGGDLFPIELTIAAHKSAGGYEFAGIVRDISKRKQDECEAQEQIRLREEFLAMLSHELRNPLNAARSASTLIARAGENVQVRDRACDVFDRQIGHMTRLLDDLLDVSRLTQGKINLQIKPADLCVVARNSIETVREIFDNKGVTLETFMPDGETMVMCDSERIFQVISNLLNNSAKYTHSGGSVSLTILNDQDRAVIRVQDNGVGIPDELLAQIFDMFVQSETTIDRSDGGMGVGLTLSRKLIEMHGGSITAQSDGVDKGSCFEVTLPLCKSNRNVVREKRAKYSTSGRKVVVIEDNPDCRAMLVDILELDGHEVMFAGDGLKGLELIETQQPDVAFVDIGLPGMDGYQIARKIRESFRSDEIYMIACTGYGRASDKVNVNEAGFDHHLVKPLSMERLQKAFEDATEALSGAVKSKDSGSKT